MDRADKWLDWITTQMFGLMHNVETDNFDVRRYGEANRQVFVYQQHASYFTFLRRNSAKFMSARDLLVDQESKELFDWLVLFRLLGHRHVRLPFNTEQTRDYEAEIRRWRVEDTGDVGLLGPLSLFVVPVGEDALCVKCWDGGIAANLLFRQYYLDRDGARVMPAAGDCALDVGACFGDTALFFARDVGESGLVHTFDPMPKHCEIMRQNFEMNPVLASRIVVHPYGLSDHEQEITAVRGGIDPGARIADDLPTRTLDSLSLPKVDYVKMDVEGSELAALKGGEETVRRFRPKLAISLYHRPEDFFTIPLWINGLGCGYRLFLGHYSMHHEETVLYATAA